MAANALTASHAKFSPDTLCHVFLSELWIGVNAQTTSEAYGCKHLGVFIGDVQKSLAGHALPKTKTPTRKCRG